MRKDGRSFGAPERRRFSCDSEDGHGYTYVGAILVLTLPLWEASLRRWSEADRHFTLLFAVFTGGAAVGRGRYFDDRPVFAFRLRHDDAIRPNGTVL